MKQTLQLKLTQNLTLTPQLQQAIRLLQLSTLELSQELENYIAANPLLERDDENDGPSYQSDPSLPSQTTENTLENIEMPNEEESAWNGTQDQQESSIWDTVSVVEGAHSNDDDNDYLETPAKTTSLHEHLIWQLNLAPLGEQDQALVYYLIEMLDDNGYLSAPLEEIVAEFNAVPDSTTTIDDLRIALKYLRTFDPAGVGACNVQECLLLQLNANYDCNDEIPVLASVIIEKHLDLLASRDFITLKKRIGCKEDKLRAACELIQHLDPKPGARFAPDDTRYVIPDIIVRKIRGSWIAAINQDAYPRLRINRLYAQILQEQRSATPLNEQLQEARWLIRNVQQRFDTILLVAQAIVDLQRQFFDHGEVAMRPLVMREIADKVGLHESTISRVTSQKYMATPRGIFELKYFFASHLLTDSGGACSSTAIRAVIKQLIGAENTKKPLSDHKISELLGQQGIIVARRTIAKYRESMAIPPANLRKVL